MRQNNFHGMPSRYTIKGNRTYFILLNTVTNIPCKCHNKRTCIPYLYFVYLLLSFDVQSLFHIFQYINFVEMSIKKNCTTTVTIWIKPELYFHD